MPLPILPSTSLAGRSVDLGALRFNQQPDSNGVEWWLSDLGGWDSATLREDLEPRALSHGAHRGASFYGPRELTVVGALVAPALGALRAAVDDLSYAVDLTDVDTWLVVHEQPSKFVSVRRAGEPRWSIRTDHLAEFEVELTAADPRKYGTELRSLTLTDGEADLAANAGTFRRGAPVRVSFTAAGALTVGDVTIIAGAPVDVDTLEESAFFGGAAAYDRLGAGSAFPHLAPRAATPVSFTGTGSVTLTWRDAWV